MRRKRRCASWLERRNISRFRPNPTLSFTLTLVSRVKQVSRNLRKLVDPIDRNETRRHCRTLPVASLTYVDARSVLALAEVAANANDDSSLSGRFAKWWFFLGCLHLDVLPSRTCVSRTRNAVLGYLPIWPDNRRFPRTGPAVVCLGRTARRPTWHLSRWWRSLVRDGRPIRFIVAWNDVPAIRSAEDERAYAH
jgi:hypothetical protein